MDRHERLAVVDDDRLGEDTGATESQRFEVFAKSATACARLLNDKCRMHGCPAPNPSADKFNWKMIERELRLKDAQKEVAKLDEEFIERWKEQLEIDELQEIYQNASKAVFKVLKSKIGPKRKKEKGRRRHRKKE